MLMATQVKELEPERIKDERHMTLHGAVLHSASRVRRSVRRLVSARAWSNAILLDIAQRVVVTSVCNVSGWRDSDKEGRCYRSYFAAEIDYSVTNLEKDMDKGISGAEDIALDLSVPLPHHLKARFDLVLTHTVLEHVRHPEDAFGRLCEMTTGYLITVVPLSQGYHMSAGNFGDFYRFTPELLRRLHEDNNFIVLEESIGPRFGAVQYLVTLGARSTFRTPIPSRVCALTELNERAGHLSANEMIVGGVLRHGLDATALLSRGLQRVRRRARRDGVSRSLDDARS